MITPIGTVYNTTMNKPYIKARKRPFAALPEPFKKNDTVIGIIGKTQGVSNAISAQPIALRIKPQIEPPLLAVSATSTAAAAFSAGFPT